MRIAGALPRTEACGVSVVPPVYSLHGARFVYYTLLVHIHQGMVLARTLKCAFARLVGKSFGSLLHEYRKKARPSVQQLAQESELDRKYVYELEKGFSQPTLTTMFRLATRWPSTARKWWPGPNCWLREGRPEGGRGGSGEVMGHLSRVTPKGVVRRSVKRNSSGLPPSR